MMTLAIEHNLTSLERVKKVHFFHEMFSVENELLTPTFKLKRVNAKKFF